MPFKNVNSQFESYFSEHYNTSLFVYFHQVFMCL